MKLVVIESPYARSVMRTVEDNLEYARKAMRHSLSLREAPFASHLLYTQVLDDLDKTQRAQGIEAGLVWGAHADLVAVYCDFGLSRGMRLGIAAALERGTRIVYRFRPLLLEGAPETVGGRGRERATIPEDFAESLMLPDAYNHEVL